MTDDRCTADDLERYAGITLEPWQRDLLERIRRGDRIVLSTSRISGRRRRLAEAARLLGAVDTSTLPPYETLAGRAISPAEHERLRNLVDPHGAV